MPHDPVKAKQRRAARQHRYYLRNRETLLERGRATYDPEKRAEYYRENREAVRQASRLHYLCRRGDAVREALQSMCDTMENESAKHVVRAMLADGRHHEMTLSDVQTLRSTLELYPPPPLPSVLVDKCDEAVISLRQ
jgi:hypothetical protein